MIRWLNESAHDPIALPLVGVASDAGQNVSALIAWVKSERAALLPRLRRHGALLFRDFATAPLPQFEELVRVFSPDGLRGYTGGASQRKHVEGHVYTSTETAAHYAIAQHHEGAYLRIIPRIIGFICITPAETGGETPLADSRRVLARLTPELIARFASGVRYSNNLPDRFGFGKSWQQQFQTEDRREAERRLRDDGYEFEWRSNGGLRTTLRGPATLVHADTRERVWINQADHWHASGLEPGVRARLARTMVESDFPLHAAHGDGSPMVEEDLAEVRRAVAAEKRSFPWQEGDILICDNHLVSHGRNPFTGARRILVALG